MKPEKKLNVPDIQKKRFNEDNRDAILQFMEAGGDGNDEGIVLTEKQLDLYKRWNLAAEKIRERKYKREQVANFIIAAFNVSRDTAYKDIVNAEYVFAASCPLNKKFLIQQRIELLQIKINECYINNDAFNAGQLEKILQKYIDNYPETIQSRPLANLNFIVNNTTNNLIVTDMTAAKAFDAADKIINEMEDKDDY